MLNITPVVRNLLLINVLVYVVQANNLLGISNTFALYSFVSPYYFPFQYVSYMFLHGSVGHLIGNMFGLFMFGPMLEQLWGQKRFLFFYFFTGIGAGLLYSVIGYLELSQLAQGVADYIQHPAPDAFIEFSKRFNSVLYENNLGWVNAWDADPGNSQFKSDSVALVKSYLNMEVNVPMLGASGAVFGILMAFAMLFPNLELMLLFFPVPVKAKYLVGFYGVYELFSGIKNAQSDNVAHFAHIGGMLFAFILLRYWKRKEGKYY